MLEVFQKYDNHIGRSSAFYNNMMSIASTSVQNGGRRAGYENRAGGNSSVTLNGNTYSYLRSGSASASGGIRYLTYDGINEQGAVDAHIDAINGPAPKQGRTELTYTPKVVREVVEGTSFSLILFVVLQKYLI